MYMVNHFSRHVLKSEMTPTQQADITILHHFFLGTLKTFTFFSWEHLHGSIHIFSNCYHYVNACHCSFFKNTK